MHTSINNLPAAVPSSIITATRIEQHSIAPSRFNPISTSPPSSSMIYENSPNSIETSKNKIVTKLNILQLQ